MNHTMANKSASQNDYSGIWCNYFFKSKLPATLTSKVTGFLITTFAICLATKTILGTLTGDGPANNASSHTKWSARRTSN